jgi:hypothetical protein
MTHSSKSFASPAAPSPACSRVRAAAAAALLAGSMWIAPPAFATAASGFTAVQQWKGHYGPIDLKLKSDAFDLKLDTKGDADIYVTRNSIAIDGQSGWHTHPGPSLITVAVGQITVYEGSDPACAGTRYSAGEGFIDQGDGHSHLLRNESGAVAETVAVQFIPRDAVRRIDAPKPTNCQF